MLSDSIFDARMRLLEDIKHYAGKPYERDYPLSQRNGLIKALYHLELSQMAYDSFEFPDNHTFSKSDRDKCYHRAEMAFDGAIDGNSDSE